MSDKTWDELVAELGERRRRAESMGGTERVAKQRARGKLTVRERLELLVDEGSFVEHGLLADHMDPQLGSRRLPADGVVTGVGQIEGRPAAIAAYDFTVMGGSMGRVGEEKVSRMREMALRRRIPMVWLLDSAGARIQQAIGSTFALSGALFRAQVEMSGVVPMVAAVIGPCAAGTAYVPALADFVPMVEGTGSMALGGPHLVRAAVGEDVTDQELGGVDVHCRISGCADLALANDEECMDAIRRYLSYFPSNNRAMPPVRTEGDVGERSVAKLRDVVPTSSRAVYDVYEVIHEIADDGDFFPMKPDWAQNIVTGFARFGGLPAGVVANQTTVLGGVLDVDAADKAARFVWLCDAFNIPLVFLVDVPGFLVGTSVEKQGIIRHGAKMLYAVSEATVPKVTIVMRKAYGAGYFVMCGRAYESDYIVAWPTAEISVMGPEGAVNILFRKQIDAAPEDERDEMRTGMLEQVRATIDPYLAAGWAGVDDIIAPEETRNAIIHGLRMSEGKRIQRPWRKHGVLPV